MARRVMLKDTGTGRWGWYTIERPVRMPWEGAWARLGWALRYIRRHRTPFFPDDGPEYELDPDTLRMRDRRRERRQKRRDRRDRLLAKAADALNAMVEMQKHIG